MKKILDEVQLLEKSYDYPILDRSFWKDLQSYQKIWLDHYRNNSYHYRLIDQSLFRFLFYEKRISFEYINCPYTIERDTYIDVFTDEKFLRDELSIELIPTPIRYDYEPLSYDPISHPIGHVHIGLNNHIRIGTDRILNPISFLLFCLRQMYPDNWKDLITLGNFKKYKPYIRNKISCIKAENKTAFEREHFIA